MERHPFLVRAFKGSNPFIPESRKGLCFRDTLNKRIVLFSMRKSEVFRFKSI